MGSPLWRQRLGHNFFLKWQILFLLKCLVWIDNPECLLKKFHKPQNRGLGQRSGHTFLRLANSTEFFRILSSSGSGGNLHFSAISHSFTLFQRHFRIQENTGLFFASRFQNFVAHSTHNSGSFSLTEFGFLSYTWIWNRFI